MGEHPLGISSLHVKNMDHSSKMNEKERGKSGPQGPRHYPSCSFLMNVLHFWRENWTFERVARPSLSQRPYSRSENNRPPLGPMVGGWTPEVAKSFIFIDLIAFSSKTGVGVGAQAPLGHPICCNHIKIDENA